MALGPVVYIRVAGQGILVLNTHAAAADLLDRRGNIYGDRPRWIGKNIPALCPAQENLNHMSSGIRNLYRWFDDCLRQAGRDVRSTQS